MSHPEERSPKRQRRSYSPASPVAQSEPKSIVGQTAAQSLPQTPPPSVHMSPSWQSQTLSTSAPGSTTFPTPPSTSGILGQLSMERPGESEGGGSGQGTPGNDSSRDVDGDMAMNDDVTGQQEVARLGGDDVQAQRRTDHERLDSEQIPGALKLYRLDTKPIAPSRPHPSQNVISLYSLEPIQASVARRDAQGNKINKLRKSYENKVKALGLEGRSKAEVGSNALLGLVDPGWDVDIGNGTTTWQARISEFPLNEANTDTLLAKLDSAFSFAPGQFPKAEHENWKSILGLEDLAAKPAPVMSSASKLGSANASFSKTTASATSPALGMARNATPVSPSSAPRPDRMNKKRRYDESSYSGYQDGYDDDGYSTGGDDRRGGSAKRQKRRDYPSAASSPPFSSGNNNGNMVGVRTS